MRPQFGSLPKMAALNRFERVTERATVTAARSESAFTTMTAMSWLAPSASAIRARDSTAEASVTATVRAARDTSTPLAPEASRITVSFVDMQPSESIRSKVEAVAARSAASASSAVTTASVVSTESIVASPGASIPAPLAIPPTDQPARSTWTVFGTESVVMLGGAVDARQQQVHRQPLADQTGRADQHVARGHAEQRADPLGGAVRVDEAGRAGTRVRAAGVEHDGARHAIGDSLAGPHNGCGDDPIGGEDGGRNVRGPVVDDQRDVQPATALQPGSDPGGAESQGGSDGHGATPAVDRPSSSGRPRARFMD